MLLAGVLKPYVKGTLENFADIWSSWQMEFFL